MINMELWEILVPTEKPESMPGKNRYFTTRYHQIWDNKVINISNGLTIFSPSKGLWVSPSGTLFKERMIPVRIACSKNDIERIIDITAKHYSQLAIMAYKISNDVIIKSF